MMSDMKSMSNIAPQSTNVPKKSAEGADDVVASEFSLLLTDSTAEELFVFQNEPAIPRSDPAAKELSVIPNEPALLLADPPAAEVSVFSSEPVVEGSDLKNVESISPRKVTKDMEGEVPFVDIPVSEYPVIKRMALRPPPEIVVEAEPTVPVAALDGKVSVPFEIVPRAPVTLDLPLPQADLVDEKIVRLEQLADRFDQRLLSMVQRNEKVMRITVQPATMGRLTVLCREENSALSVEIVAQTNGVRELIAGQEDAIRRLMQQHSVELGSFDVVMDQGQGGERKFSPGYEAEHGDAHGTAPASTEEEDLYAIRLMHKSGAVSLIA